MLVVEANRDMIRKYREIHPEFKCCHYSGGYIRCFLLTDNLTNLKSFAQVTEDGMLMYIETLEEHRNKGNGKSLLRRIMDICCINRLIVQVSNEPALKLYRSLGFSVISTHGPNYLMGLLK